MSTPEEDRKLNQVFSNPAHQEAAVDIFVRKRPMGWGRRSVAPYYNEHCGAEAKRVMDEMMSSKEDQVYGYEYFQKKFGIGKGTLYLRVNQSMRYVVEMMDDAQRTYGRFMQMIEVKKKHGVGVIIMFKPECRDGSVLEFKPKSVEAVDDIPRWKELLNEFLETAEPGQTFLKEKLVLDAQEIADLKASLDSVEGLMHSVTSYSVKVIKTRV